jgi:hypothetical protein
MTRKEFKGSDDTVGLAERAAMMLIGAGQLGIKDKPVARLGAGR